MKNNSIKKHFASENSTKSFFLRQVDKLYGCEEFERNTTEDFWANELLVLKYVWQLYFGEYPDETQLDFTITDLYEEFDKGIMQYIYDAIKRKALKEEEKYVKALFQNELLCEKDFVYEIG